MNGTIIPNVDENVKTVAYSTGSTVSQLRGNIFRKDGLVYFSFYANGTFKNTEDIITITNASDRPKDNLYFGGAYDEGSYHGGAVFYFDKSSGSLTQSMANNANSKLVSVSGVYVPAG